MPLPLAPLVAFILGVFLAWRSRAESSPEEGVWNSQTQAVTLYACLVFAPAAGYFALFAPDWSFAYFIDGRLVPSAISLAIVLVSASAVVGGFITSRRALERHAPNELAWLAGCPLALVVIALAALHNRVGIDATYEQFVGDFGREPIFTSRLGFAVAWMDAIIATGAGLTARWLVPPSQPGQTPPLPVPSAPVIPNTDDEGAKRLLGRPKAPR
jgi:hypothetical protein